MSVARVWALPGLGGMGRLRAEFAAATETPHPSHRKKQALPAVHPNSKPWTGQDRPLTIRTAGVRLTYGRRAPARPAYVVTARTCDKSTTRQRGRPAV